MTAATLSRALSLGPHECVAIAGGGGKTTIMYRLAAEATGEGRTAVVGGTTRFTAPHLGVMPPLLLLDREVETRAAVLRALAGSPAVTCSAGHGDKGRWLPIGLEQADAIARMPEVDLLALEADGSRNRPFKAPGDGEPGVPAAATLVLTVAGLDVIGRPLDPAWVHRPERVALLTGTRPGEPVTPACVAAVLLHADGGRKGLPAGARWLPVLNKAEPERYAAGIETARLLLEGGARAVLLATAAAAHPVVRLLTR